MVLFRSNHIKSFKNESLLNYYLIMVSLCVSGSTGPGSSYSWEHCVVLLGETPYSYSPSLAYF